MITTTWRGVFQHTKAAHRPWGLSSSTPCPMKAGGWEVLINEYRLIYEMTDAEQVAQGHTASGPSLTDARTCSSISRDPLCNQGNAWKEYVLGVTGTGPWCWCISVIS